MLYFEQAMTIHGVAHFLWWSLFRVTSASMFHHIYIVSYNGALIIETLLSQSELCCYMQGTGRPFNETRPTATFLCHSSGTVFP